MHVLWYMDSLITDSVDIYRSPVSPTHTGSCLVPMLGIVIHGEASQPGCNGTNSVIR